MNAVVSTIPAAAPVNLLEVITRAAADPAVDVAKTEKLLEMYERITAEQAKMAFNAAMTASQKEMGPISADMENKQTRSRYASFAKLDKVLRPIYTRHGFALSFDEGDSPKLEHVRVLCYVSHIAGHTRTYHRDMPADGKGAKGGDVMTKTHAAGAAGSYGARYLLKGIFNVAIGEEDRDGNDLPTITEKQIADLQALLEEVGADKAKFLRYYRLDSLDQILASNYASVVSLVEAKRTR